MKKAMILAIGLITGTGVGITAKEVISRKERKLLNELLFVEENIRFMKDLMISTGKRQSKDENLLDKVLNTKAYKEVLDDYSKIRYLVASILEHGLIMEIRKDIDIIKDLKVKYINNSETRKNLLDQVEKEIKELEKQ